MEHRHYLHKPRYSLQKLRHSRAGGNPTPIQDALNNVAEKIAVRSWAPAYAGVTRHVSAIGESFFGDNALVIGISKSIRNSLFGNANRRLLRLTNMAILEKWREAGKILQQCKGRLFVRFDLGYFRDAKPLLFKCYQ
jgi:hypothetical protein